MNIMDVLLRNEQICERKAVEELTREAFWNHHSPGCDEHYLVHIMRNDTSFIKELDIVALHDSKVIANIMYTKAIIISDNGKEYDTISFGPISVLPEYQGFGIGTKLIEHTKELATKLGYTSIVIYGDPDFYSKFGFIPAENFGIATASNMYTVSLQAYELIKGSLSHCNGRFFEDPIFKIHEQDAKKFDMNFAKKDYVEGLPSQKRFSELVSMERPKECPSILTKERHTNKDYAPKK